MQLSDDGPLAVQQTAGSVEPSRPWMLGLIAGDDGPLVKSALRPYSFKSECECPYDCLRDHENE
jgi:hypothetical protein